MVEDTGSLSEAFDSAFIDCNLLLCELQNPCRVGFCGRCGCLWGQRCCELGPLSGGNSLLGRYARQARGAIIERLFQQPDDNRLAQRNFQLDTLVDTADEFLIGHHFLRQCHFKPCTKLFKLLKSKTRVIARADIELLGFKDIVVKRSLLPVNGLQSGIQRFDSCLLLVLIRGDTPGRHAAVQAQTQVQCPRAIRISANAGPTCVAV